MWHQLYWLNLWYNLSYAGHHISLEDEVSSKWLVVVARVMQYCSCSGAGRMHRMLTQHTLQLLPGRARRKNVVLLPEMKKDIKISWKKLKKEHKNWAQFSIAAGVRNCSAIYVQRPVQSSNETHDLHSKPALAIARCCVLNLFPFVICFLISWSPSINLWVFMAIQYGCW